MNKGNSGSANRYSIKNEEININLNYNDEENDEFNHNLQNDQ